MKQLIAVILLIITLSTASFVITTPAYAVDVFPVCTPGSAASGTTVCNDATKTTTGNPIVGIISSVIQVLSILIGIAAVIGIIISGLRMTLANGDSNSIASARSALVYSLIGVAVAALAEVIVKFVLGSIG